MTKKQKENNDCLWKDGKFYFRLGSGWEKNESLHEPIVSVCFNVLESFCGPQQGTPHDVLTAPWASLLVALLSVLPLTLYASSAHTNSPSR